MTGRKLKIILVNYRFFVSGGPERYMFNIIDLLQKKGHEVIPFSIKSKHNSPTEYEKYFLDPVGKGDEVYFSDQEKSNVKTILQSFSRMYYSTEAKKKLSKLIEDVQPDLLYVLYYQNKISASIFDTAKQYNLPVVHRISDFGQICANALFFRPAEKDVCERCMHGTKWNAVANKCVYNSYIYSALKAGSMAVAEHILHVKKKIDAFVVPSAFTLKKLAEYGFPKEKLNHVPTFFNINNYAAGNISYQPYALYIGRIEEEKGIRTMVNAFINTGFSLKIIGFSTNGLDEELKKYLEDKQHNIEFLGKKNFSEITPYLSSCAFTIVPSECYDNFPNTVLESYAFKKAVLATNLGSLTDIVEDGKSGFLFETKNHQALQQKAAMLFKNEALCRELGENGYGKILNEYSEEAHYKKLETIFDSVLKRKQVPGTATELATID
ncbi:MAG: glycosyltransferase family 4 protein [Ferruginibacter sp.]